MPKPDEIFYTDKDGELTSGWLSLIQETDKEGKVWDVMIIKAGWSKNGVFYSSKVLKEARPLFEGANVFAYQFKDRFFDHLPENAAELVKQGFAKNLTGWLDGIRWGEVNGQEGLIGKYHVTDDFIRRTLKNSWSEGKKDLLGFSIDAKGTLVPGIADGRYGKIAEKIRHVNSVDQVTLPAAGGKFLRLVASKGGSKMNEQIKKLVEMVRENPEVLGLEEGINLEEKGDEEVFEMLCEALEARRKKKKDEEEDTEEAKKKKKKDEEEMEMARKKKKDEEEKESGGVSVPSDLLGKIAEMLKGKKIDEAQDIIEQFLKGKYKDKYKDQDKSARASDEKAGEEEKKKTELPAELKDKVTEVQEALDKLNIKESQVTLNEILAKETILPDIAKDKIRESFKDVLVEQEKVEERIKEEKEYLGSLSESGDVKGMGDDHITTGMGKQDRMAIAMHKLFGNEPTEKEKKDWEGVPAFRGIREAYNQYTGDNEVSMRQDRITEALSTDFPNALGDALHRKLIKAYVSVPVTSIWRKFVTIDNPSDYKDQYFIRVGSLTDLPVVAEDGTYTEWTSPSEEQVSYAVTKKGKILKVTRKMIINDDLKIIKRMTDEMGKAAARTLAKFVFDLVLNYSGGAINGGTYSPDSKAVYHADHNNLTYNALDYNTLDTAITDMGDHTDIDANEPIDIRAQYLLVPRQLRSTAKVLIDSEKRPIQPTSTSTTGTVESANPVYKAVEPLDVPKGYLRSDENNWYVLANKVDLDYIIVGFLNGREEPEMFLQDNPSVDQVFTNDRVRYKIRHEYNGVVSDYRGLYAGLLAGLS